MHEKIKFRDELKEYVKRTLRTDPGNLTPIRQSKAMTRFYVREILKSYTPGLIPSDEDDFENCIIDGSNDCGVDFLSRAEGTVIIIQAKCRGYGKPEKLDDLVSFCEVLKRLHPRMGAAYEKNQKLIEAIGDIDWESDFFQLHYITLGRAGENIQARVDEGPTLIPGVKDIEDRCELTLYDETQLNIRLREALSAGETIAQPVALRFLPTDDGSPWLKLESGRKRSFYLGFVGGSEIAELYRPHRFRLFAMNIRDWIGDTATNKGIVLTAGGRPEDFLFFNNGVSAVATSIDEDSANCKLVCKNFSIINGAQTVRSLFKAQSRNPESVKRATVMVRISTFSLGKEPAFLEDVTRYNNTQNKMAVSDFRSNDPVQRDLAERFSKMTRVGVRFWYKNKRSREQRDRIPIEMEEFAKTIHAFRFGPHDMWGGTSPLFDASKDGRYSFVFGNGEAVWGTVPENEFYALSGIWFLCEEIRRIWKEEKGQRPKDDATALALERRYLVYYAVGELLRMIYSQGKRNLEDDLRKLSKPNWTEKNGPEKAATRELTELAFSALVRAYETAARSKDFRHRNWFRDKDYLAGIRSDLKFIRDIRMKGREGLPMLFAGPGGSDT